MLDKKATLSLDGAAFGAVFASINGWLHPVLEAVSLILSIVWLSMQIGTWVVKKWKSR